MPERIKCVPKSTVIRSMVKRKIGLPDAMSELVDNSCDKGATRIEMILDRSLVTIVDNGRGVADLPGMMTIGFHNKEIEDDEDTIGRYGVGFKDAVIWLGRTLEVDTRHNGKRRSVTADWEEVERSEWEFVFGDIEQEIGQPSFTKIAISDIYEHRLSKQRTLGRTLAFRFMPAILNGTEIIVNGETLVPPPLPELSDEVTVDDHFGGLHYRMTVGILVNPRESHHGYNVAYRNRLIREEDTDDAFGSYSDQRIFGYIELLDDGEDHWTLTRNKEDFDERPEFYEHLFTIIEPLLKKADSLGENLRFRELETELSTDIGGAVARFVRERRERKGGKGTHGSTGSGKRRTNASKIHSDQSGSVLDKRQRNTPVQVKFDYVRDDAIGSVQFSPSSIIVHLNPDNLLFVSRQKYAMAASVCAMLANEFAHDQHKDQGDLQFTDEARRFVEYFTDFANNLLSLQDEQTAEQDAKEL